MRVREEGIKPTNRNVLLSNHHTQPPHPYPYPETPPSNPRPNLRKKKKKKMTKKKERERKERKSHTPLPFRSVPSFVTVHEAPCTVLASISPFSSIPSFDSLRHYAHSNRAEFRLRRSEKGYDISRDAKAFGTSEPSVAWSSFDQRGRGCR